MRFQQRVGVVPQLEVVVVLVRDFVDVGPVQRALNDWSCGNRPCHQLLTASNFFIMMGKCGLVNSPGGIPSLDGIRAVAVCLVVIGHLNGYGTSVLLGVFGVHVFFVLSGYLITRLLQEEQAGSGRISIGAFYRRRCFRILPAAYVFMALLCLASPRSREGILYALTYSVSYHAQSVSPWLQHLWSLSVEEQFYLLWPLALVLWFRRRAAIALAAMIFSAGFRVFLALSPTWYSLDRLHFSFLGTMDSIASGCLLAIFEPEIKAALESADSKWLAAITIPSAWISFALLWGHSKNSHASALQSGLWVVVPVLIAISIYLLMKHGYAALNSRPAILLGALSYSIYLWQQPFAIHAAFPKAISLGMLAVCALASYHLVERPMLALGRSARRAPEPATCIEVIV